MDGLTVMTGQNTERSLDINLNGHPSESMTGPWFMFTPTSPVSYLEIPTIFNGPTAPPLLTKLGGYGLKDTFCSSKHSKP